MGSKPTMTGILVRKQSDGPERMLGDNRSKDGRDVAESQKTPKVARQPPEASKR